MFSARQRTTLDTYCYPPVTLPGIKTKDQSQAQSKDYFNFSTTKSLCPQSPTCIIYATVVCSGFRLKILCVSQSGNHLENNLAKFGYILNMKVEKQKKQESLYVLDYLLELIIKILSLVEFSITKIAQNSTKNQV